MTTRRRFLKNSALASFGGLLVPNFINAIDLNENKNSNHGKAIVVVQFSGGNDGLNTIVPFKNDLYYKARPSIAITEDDVLELKDDVGMHPKLKAVRDLYEEGHVSVVNSVGYNNMKKNHLSAMDIWHTASEVNEFLGTGWIGRFLDFEKHKGRKPYHAIELDATLSRALKGEHLKGFALADQEKLHKIINNNFYKGLSSSFGDSNLSNLNFLYSTLGETVSSAEYIYEKTKGFKLKTVYPLTQFALNLKKTAELIITGIETKIYFITLPGFDTHVNQLPKHERLMNIFSEGIKYFVKDLKAHNRFKDVVIMTFSEFGRSVSENVNGGTDHGKANNMLLIGGGLKKPGLNNDWPDLSNLDNGDLIPKVDFRSVYATLLNKWLHEDDKNILNQDYPYLDFI